MCGEHSRHAALTLERVGSSPHVRGARRTCPIHAGGYGIIPACAGSTYVRRCLICISWDHPRMCGEHQFYNPQTVSNTGSSPHVRGALNTSEALTLVNGIIPACAGSTHFLAFAVAVFRDHPRMCGEHSAQMARDYKAKGSSPHVRGARRHGHERQHRQGIIPACAGSTSTTPTRPCRSRDHPRMCGEHTAQAKEGDTLAGSSPHVRGAPVGGDFVGVNAGIIPACAGSTSDGSKTWQRRRDHPRMCGEHRRTVWTRVQNRGSSPHVRGAL